MNDVDVALVDAEQSVAIDPHNTIGLLERGIIYKMKKRDNDARPGHGQRSAILRLPPEPEACGKRQRDRYRPRGETGEGGESPEQVDDPDLAAGKP